MSPIMEVLTGIMIAILIYYSGTLIANNEIKVNNFFSFLAAMMLAYQPVRALSTLNMVVNQGLSAANRILPIVDTKNSIKDKNNAKDIDVSEGSIKFKNVSFKYEANEKNVLNNINLDDIDNGYFFESDTTGEKPYEEFYTENEIVKFDAFENIGVIKNNPIVDKKDHFFYDKFLPHFSEYLPSDTAVIDVGANVGDTVVGMCQKNPRLQYVCIEANNDYYNKFKIN